MTYQLKNKIINKISYANNIKNLIHSYLIPNYVITQKRLKKLLNFELNKLNNYYTFSPHIHLNNQSFIYTVKNENITDICSTVNKDYHNHTIPLNHNCKLSDIELKELVVMKDICNYKRTHKGIVLIDKADKIIDNLPV